MSAREVLWPSDEEIIVRVAFLYVGQGESTIVLAADTGSYQTMLVDINCDATRHGIDVPRLMHDLLAGGSLSVFVNTHPHNDHLCGVARLSEAVQVDAVWHSGHTPGRKHEDAYRALQDLIGTVTRQGGTPEALRGSRTPRAIGEATCYTLAPAAYVTDDIAGEDPERRYRRIHEHCVVLKIGHEPTWIMLTGDADRDAWEHHIANYHQNHLRAAILSAPHHGSRTFFQHDEADEPYLAALETIAPTYVVVSAPHRGDSPHGHPHDDALERYADQVGPENILHTGEHRYTFIADIYRDGTYAITDDKGRLADHYGLNGNSGMGRTGPLIITTRIDDRPMGS